METNGLNETKIDIQKLKYNRRQTNLKVIGWMVNFFPEANSNSMKVFN